MFEKVLQQQGIPATQEATPQEPATTDTGAKTTSETETPKPRILESPRLAALAKKERAILDQQKKFKADQEAFAKQKQEFEEWQKARDNAKKNPKDYLKRGGLEYEDVTNFFLNDEKPTADAKVSEVEQKLADLQKRLEDKEREQEEQLTKAQQEQIDKTIADYKESLKEMAEADPEKYELINTYEAHDLVYETIEGHWNEQLRLQEEDPTHKPKVLSKEEALDMVERFLEEEATQKFSKSKKLKAKLGFMEPEKKQEEAKKPDGWGAKTLTNEAISSAPSLLTPKNENERLKRALSALGGN